MRSCLPCPALHDLMRCPFLHPASSCAVSTGAVDDIRRATDLAYRAVSEYGLSVNIGPLSVGTLISGGDDYAMLKDSGSPVARCAAVYCN